MKKFTFDEIIQKYLESANIIESVTMTTDYKTNNREVNKLFKLFLLLEQDIDLAKKVYSRILESEIPTAQIIASADCLRLNIYVDEAQKKLEELSKRDDIGIISFNAEMALKIWRGEVPGKKL